MAPRRICSVLVVAFFAVPSVVGAQAIPESLLAHGTLSFDAKATLGAFTGVTSTVTAFGFTLNTPTAFRFIVGQTNGNPVILDSADFPQSLPGVPPMMTDLDTNRPGITWMASTPIPANFVVGNASWWDFTMPIQHLHNWVIISPTPASRWSTSVRPT